MSKIIFLPLLIFGATGAPHHSWTQGFTKTAYQVCDLPTLTTHRPPNPYSPEIILPPIAHTPTNHPYSHPHAYQNIFAQVFAFSAFSMRFTCMENLIAILHGVLGPCFNQQASESKINLEFSKHRGK